MKTPTAQTEKKLPEAGVHPASLIWAIDLGTQPSTNPAYNPKRKLLLTWELPTQKTEFDGVEKPMVVSYEYGFNTSDKGKLHALCQSWLREDVRTVDWEKTLGKPALVTIVHNESGGKTYANVTAVSGVPKGMDVDAPWNPRFCLSLEPEWYEPNTFEALPEWIRKKVMNSPEWTICSTRKKGS